MGFVLSKTSAHPFYLCIKCTVTKNVMIMSKSLMFLSLWLSNLQCGYGKVCQCEGHRKSDLVYVADWLSGDWDLQQVNKLAFDLLANRRDPNWAGNGVSGSLPYPLVVSTNFVLLSGWLGVKPIFPRCYCHFRINYRCPPGGIICPLEHQNTTKSRSIPLLSLTDK